ncbi:MULTISPECIES: hypothetical protein [Streptomyces]|uniref:hypothetical protein n=1 Tax=Streptomyces TaxID=1883 RepID=UPI001E588920|nr:MULTISPECIES: hypothetical protein [Streptomyces]UFQ16986.1 hypothetical protein J2N69_19370 [Streptomyces huasconensis]WCL86588.1 hypothetical protein PPN52_19375 [Streptomyces sp. JCM 35825]
MPKTVLSAALLVLACLLVPLGALSTWAKHEIGDRDGYVATMAPLASDDAVRTAVAEEVSGAVMKEIDAGPLQGTVEAFVHDAVRSFTETAAYRTAWDAANRAAHDAVQSALNDDTNGEVVIDLAPITEQIKRQLSDDGVPLASKIPVRHTEITILQSQDLGQLRQCFHALQVAGVWPAVAAALLAVAGVLLATRRRRAVVATALGAALAAAALVAAVAIGRALTLDDLPSDVSRDAAGAVYDALTASLRTAAWVLVGVGLLVALGAWLLPRLRGSARP